jgi:hypothetical protein
MQPREPSTYALRAEVLSRVETLARVTLSWLLPLLARARLACFVGSPGWVRFHSSAMSLSKPNRSGT